MTRRRLDAELVRRGIVADREEAREAVGAGRVTVRGSPATNVSTLVADDEPVALSTPDPRFVSRGGPKLRAALDRFRVGVSGLDCLDAGASTGGFTDCLLQAGARRVIAVDVGYGQLDWRLRTDRRVTVLERTNVRDLTPSALPFLPTVLVADLSFVPLRSIVGHLARLTAPGARALLLVKPSFEASSGEVDRGGVVRDPAVWERVIAEVAAAAAEAGFASTAAMVSPLTGPAGNVEFFLDATSGAPGAPPDRLTRQIRAAVAEALEVVGT